MNQAQISQAQQHANQQAAVQQLRALGPGLWLSTDGATETFRLFLPNPPKK